MVLDVDVLGPSVHETALAQCDAGLTVLEDRSRFRLLDTYGVKKLSQEYRFLNG